MTTGSDRRKFGWQRTILVAVPLLASLFISASAHAADPWSWPLTGPVLRGFDPPKTAFGSGHRGIDIACRPGTLVRSTRSGIVTFAGSVGGQRYVTVTHADGVQSTASWVDGLLVRKNDSVVAGAPIATCGVGHTGAVIPHLHLGVRAADGTYVDPLSVLPPPRLTTFLRLAPR